MKEQSTIKEKVYNLILEDIMSHQYEPSDVINEKELIEKYGYSKTPVREALISLCDHNVLRSIPRYGYEVVRLTMDDVREMLRYRWALEIGILTSNIQKFGRNQIARLREIDKSCTDAGDVWGHWASNTEFHRMMLVFAGNTYAADQLEKCMNQLKRAYAQLYWENSDMKPLAMDTKYHENILEALENRDTEALAKWLKDDLNDFAGGNMDYPFVQ